MSSLATNWPAWAFVALFSAIEAIKLPLLAEVSRMLDCRGCLVEQHAIHEGQLLLWLLALHQFARWQGSRLLRVAAGLGLLGVLLVSAIDAVVSRLFMVRFNAHELTRFVGEGGAVVSILEVAAGSPARLMGLTALFVALVVIAVAYGRARPAACPTRRSPWGWVFPLLASLALMPLMHDDFYGPQVENSVHAFSARQTRVRAYPEGFSVAAQARPVSRPGLPADPGRQPDIVLLIVESLSNFQSRAWSGLNDWTPEFDQLTREGISLPGFHANGINSEDGLVALLTGQPPIPRPGRGTLFTQFAEVRDTLPRWLDQQGYRTAFMTTGDLRFMAKGEWLADIGFAQVEGHEHPFYDGMRRFHFSAAPDEALYGRARQWLRQQRDQRIFLTLETVSSHQPYVDPVSDAPSMERAFRYADHALGDFVRSLRAAGFFDHGYLIVTGDHRAMVPLSAAERRRYGDRGFARVPLLVLGPALRGGAEVRGAFSQTDLLPSIRHWLGSTAPRLPRYQGLFLASPTQPADCLYTRRAYDPDRVVLQCGDDDWHIRLDADDTRFIGMAGPPDAIQDLHRLRLGDDW